MGTTAFPGAVDDFATTSPTNLGDDDNKGRTHSERHDDIESAMEAVQAELGTDPAGTYSTVKARLDGGMVLVTSGTFTTVGTVSIDNCFTSAHDDYAVEVEISASSTTLGVYLRLRAGGTDADGGSDYRSMFVYASDSAPTKSNNTASYHFGVSVYNGYTANFKAEMLGPAIAAATTFRAFHFSRDVTYDTTGFGHTRHAVATAYDGFTFYTSTGTITGKYRVYGLPK